MAFNFSIGGQIIGDLSGSDDSDRNTVIDFEEDYIGFVTSGSTILSISGSDVYLTNGSNLYLGGNSKLFFDADDGTNFIDVFAEEDGTNNLLIDGNNRVKLRADQQIIIQENGSTKVDFNFDNDDIRVYLHTFS